jgi:hypothetical protein
VNQAQFPTYISLERIRQLEQQAVKASTEMQHEARKVINENEQLRTENARQEEELRLLRAELNRLGISIPVPRFNGGTMVPYRSLNSNLTLPAGPSSYFKLKQLLQPQRPECRLEPHVKSFDSSSSQPPLGGRSRPSISAPNLKNRETAHPDAPSTVFVRPTAMDAREDPYDTVPAHETAMALEEWITMKQDSRSPTMISWPGQTM